MRYILPLLPLVLVAACGSGDDDDDDETISPVEYGRTRMVAAGEENAGEIANPNLPPGASYEVIKFETPDLLCVRTTTDDLLHIPEASDTPGEPGVFWVVPPTAEDSPVALVLHGGALDFIEAEASLFAHAEPEIAAALLEAGPEIIGFADIISRGGAEREIESTIRGANVTEALERGWGVVLPGNCWGDGGHGRGEEVVFEGPRAENFANGARWGHTMDRGSWDWFRAEYAHDDAREYSMGCSGGGQRTAQLLLDDPQAVAASFIDSPADYLAGFIEEPYPTVFSVFASTPGFWEVMDAFYNGHYGGFEAAKAQSLGTQLLERGIQTPIYYTYSSRDPLVTPPISGPLAASLSQRTPASRAVVEPYDKLQHCQIGTREEMAPIADWLLQWSVGD